MLYRSSFASKIDLWSWWPVKSSTWASIAFQRRFDMGAAMHAMCNAVCKIQQAIEGHLRGEIGKVGDHLQDLLEHILALLTAHGLHDGEQDLLQLGEQVGQPAHAIQHCAQGPQAPEGR